MKPPLSESPPYSTFAEVYDSTMHDVPYLQWASYIYQTLSRHGLGSQSVVADFACGTGIIHRHLAPYYPNLIGLDLSEKMLKVAGENTRGSEKKLVLGDMEFLPFAGASLDAALCIHDSLNYLLEEEKLLQHFQEAARVIKPEGVYIFDISTEFNVIHYYHSKTFYEEHERYRVMWSNHYDFQERVITSVLEFFPLPESRLLVWARNLGLPFRKRVPESREVHKQKIFSDERVIKLAEEAGFTIIETIPDYGEYESAARAQLTVFIALRN